MTEIAKFVHLRNHSAYSLAEGAIKIDELTSLCERFKMPAVAITDSGNLFGAMEFSLAATKNGIKPILGVELSLEIKDDKNNSHYGPVVALVESEEGFKALSKLVSDSYLCENNAEKVHIKLENIQNLASRKGVILLTGGVNGPIGKLISLNQSKKAEELLDEFIKLFPDALYIELERHGKKEEDLLEDQFLDLAFKKDIPIVATNNCYFVDKSMHEAHEVLLCIADGKYISENSRRKVTPHHYFKSPEEMCALFSDLPEALENTVNIAKRCSFCLEPQKPMLPAFDCGEGRGEKEELLHQAKSGLHERLKVALNGLSAEEKAAKEKIYNDRLAHELSIIIDMGFAGYFLIVADFIKWAKDQGIPVGPGRGSGAGSLTAWSLTITDVDPIRFDLIFERFLNPERVSLPDFDIDFCQDRRDEVIQYVQDKYGVDHVAQIITFGKLQARAVLRDVGRVLQMPYGQVDKICKLVPYNPANPISLKEALKQETQLVEIQKEAVVEKLISIALKLEGLYRHASTHAAGIIIGDRPLQEIVPLYRDPRSTMPVTQFSMKYVELTGLIKFDFLGLKTLTILEESAKIARDNKKEIYISEIPLDDKKTFELLNRKETTGVFQLESVGMRDVIQKLIPDRFEEIIALVALYRPGPMDDIPRYIACKHGKEEVVYMHPLLEKILKETFGVMVYQEQVMQIAQVLSGYTLGAADLLRRAMGKKIKSEMNAQRKIFIDGAKEKGISESLSNQIFDQVAKFAGYGFNKSHSAPYALIAYQTAYMKANFPAEFMAATMTYDISNTDKLSLYKRELSIMGIQLLPPDINQSEVHFSVDYDHKSPAIRYALSGIKNVGEHAMESIVEERKRNGDFSSIQDFFERANPKVLNRRQLEKLIWAGAFDSLHSNRNEIVSSLDELIRYAVSSNNSKESNQISFFDGTASRINAPSLRTVPDLLPLERLKCEHEAIGFYLSAHPLEAYEHETSEIEIVKSTDILDFPSSSCKMIGIVTSLKKKISKSGKKYAFASFSDANGEFEGVVFSETLEQYNELLESETPLIIDIAVNRDGESGVRLTVQKVTPIGSHRLHATSKKLFIEVETPKKALPFLKTAFDENKPGDCNIYLKTTSSCGLDVTVCISKNVEITPSCFLYLKQNSPKMGFTFRVS